MNSSPQHERETADRRHQPTSPWAAFRGGGRRMHNRRSAEERRDYFVDRFSTAAFLWVMLLLTLSIVDGVITLQLLDVDCQEINPFMSYLLRRGSTAFMLGKYVLTAAGIPILLIFKNFSLFR